MLKQLEAKFPDMDVSEYISFHSLRSVGLLGGVPVTEQIYIHSKLMIVDDRVVIIGSANINDRSLLGDRDSEIGLVISDSDLVDGIFNGQPFSVSTFAHTLRCQLFLEHLGLSPTSGAVVDPICEDSWYMWQQRSKSNTELLHQTFPGIPDDSIRFLKDYQAAQTAPVVAGQLERVVGHLVDYPSHFLGDEAESEMASSQRMVGTQVFV